MDKMKSRHYFYRILWIFLLSFLYGCALKGELNKGLSQEDIQTLEGIKTSLTLDSIKEILNLEGDLFIDYNYYEKIRVPKRGDLTIIVISTDLGPVVEIVIGKYDSLYRKQYEEKPYKDSGFFEYNKTGSRSYSTLSRDKAGGIVSNQIFFSSSDYRWDIHIAYRSEENTLGNIYELAKKIDSLLTSQ